MNYDEIIKKYNTPLYIYNVDKLLKRIEYLKSIFNTSKLVYAIKANSFIVKEIEDSIDKYEICSIGEFDICNKLNIDHNKMVISGVNKDKDFIERLISNYEINRYTIESLEQYKILDDLSKKYNKKINVIVRLTSLNQFGVSEEDFKYIINNHNKELMNIEGLEYFSGTQKHSIKRIDKEVDYINEFIDVLLNECNFKIKEVEYGPGLPIMYYQTDEFDEESFLKEVNNSLSRLNCEEVLIESGRSIVADCGEYLTSVVDLKSNKTGNYAIVDGGIHQLVYYGSTLAMKIPHFRLLNNKEKKTDNYNIYGSLCTINDVLMKNVDLPKLSIGDVFVFEKVGAYSSTEGISLFLSRDLPKIVLYKNCNCILVRDRIETSNVNYPDYGCEE